MIFFAGFQIALNVLLCVGSSCLQNAELTLPYFNINWVQKRKSAVLFHKHNYLVGIKNNKKEHG